MNDLSIKYSIEKLDANDWNGILSKFDDASVYQTDIFAKYSFGGSNLEQFILTFDEKIIAAALVRIKTVPIINKGIAYIRWAPLWQKKDSKIDPNIFKIALDMLRQEYVTKRKLVLRIMSNLNSKDQINSDIVLKSGYKFYSHKSESIIIDLLKDEETLKLNLRKKWRYSLRQAEKQDLKIEIGTDESFFDKFFEIYKQMHTRKNFDENVNIENFRQINNELPNTLKLQIFICSIVGEPLSAMVTSVIGKTGIYLLGGTTKKGLELSSSYLLQWEVIKWMKSHGLRSYDLGGIDKEDNPGVYTFKSGMGGEEISFLSGFEASEGWMSKLIVNLAEKLR